MCSVFSLSLLIGGIILIFNSGGSSYASYENVVTKSRIVASETVVNIASSIDLTIAAGASFEGDLCSGGGVGAIVLFCTVSNFTSQICQGKKY